MVKENVVFIAGHQARLGMANAQEAGTPDGFHGKVFKDRMSERVEGHMISLCTLF